MKDLLIKIIKFYKYYISPTLSRMFGNACRFTPTCSEYTIEALDKYGLLKGTLMGVKRLAKCNPLGGSGYDPVK